MKNTLSRKIVGSLVIASLLFMSGGVVPAFAGKPVSNIDEITASGNPCLGDALTISGSGIVSPASGSQIDQYHIQVVWSATDTENGIPLTVTNASSPYTYTFTAGPHAYTDTPPAIVTVKLYHTKPTGHDNQVDDFKEVPTCPNAVPTAESQSVSTDEDIPLGITLAATDTDTDALTYAIVTAPLHGTLSGTAPNVTYTPEEDYNGTDSFEFIANDGQADSEPATVSITVNPVNDAPVALDDAYSVSEDATLTVSAPGVLANDTDIDGDALSATLTSDVSNGTLALTSDGGFAYVPHADFAGTDTFTYTVNDGVVPGNVATVSILVSNENDVPIAVADDGEGYGTDEDTLLTVSAPGVLSNDTDVDGDALSATLTSDVSNGTLALTSDGSFTYLPDENFHGTDSFTYKAYDGEVYSGTVTVSITVNPVNDAPVAEGQALDVPEDTELNGIVSATDIDGDALTYEAITVPIHGTLIFSELTGAFTYTPEEDYNGTDSFIIKANDGTEDSNEATIDITITPVNDAPTIALNGDETVHLFVGDEYTEEGVTADDVDGDELTQTATGEVDTSTPGTYTLTYEVSDGELTASVTRTVIVSETLPVPQAPTPAPTPTPSGGGSVSTAFLGGGASSGGLVLGASTVANDEGLPEDCSPYLRDYLRMGKKNDPAQVILLQTFLNKHLSANLPVTGYFGIMTHKAVEQFQLENQDQVLDPWTPYGLKKGTPTGYVYKTTKRWINLTECRALDIPMPALP